MIHVSSKQFTQSIILILSFVLFSCGSSKEVVPTNNESIAKVEDSIDKKSLYDKMMENNDLPVEERIALYHQLKKEAPEEYNFESDRELNQYGYFLMSDGRVKEAIEIFKVLVAEFPESSNPYDSLGEAYLTDGNEELALVNYEKSVELNPENYHGMDQITILKGLEILVTDWGKEFFHFPLHFAPEIPFEGVEEVVFPKNWIKPDSADFWSYAFVWELDNKKKISTGELERSFRSYFDGLMKGVNDDENAEMIQTSANFWKNEDPSDNADLMGKLTIFDAFATNKPLDLNAKMFSRYCKEREKLILLFHFSPQDYSHSIWAKLSGSVLIRETICEE
ncbi:MAG: tetratricopeptide repeat protein [Crocinitomicaceae bacterium]